MIALRNVARWIFLSAVLFLSVSTQAKEVTLKWIAVHRALSYEIQIERDAKTVAIETVKSTFWKTNLQYGFYTYRIRAIDRVNRPGKWSDIQTLTVMPPPLEFIALGRFPASVQSREWASPVSNTEQAFVEQRSSVATEQLFPTGFHPPPEKRLDLSISPFYETYNYNVVSPQTKVAGSASGLGFAPGFLTEFDYWFGQNWGVRGNLSLVDLQVSGSSFSSFGFSADLMYRSKFKALNTDWDFSSFFGPVTRQYVFVTPLSLTNTASLDSNTITAFGFETGATLTRQFTPKWAGHFTTKYFLPLSLLGYSGSISPDLSYRNLGIGVSLSDRIGEKWTANFGASYELRSISYIPNGSSSPEKLSLDGVTFFVGATFHIYSPSP